jgi:hypothetical protein
MRKNVGFLLKSAAVTDSFYDGGFDNFVNYDYLFSDFIFYKRISLVGGGFFSTLPIAFTFLEFSRFLYFFLMNPLNAFFFRRFIYIILNSYKYYPFKLKFLRFSFLYFLNHFFSGLKDGIFKNFDIVSIFKHKNHLKVPFKNVFFSKFLDRFIKFYIKFYNFSIYDRRDFLFSNFDLRLLYLFNSYIYLFFFFEFEVFNNSNRFFRTFFSYLVVYASFSNIRYAVILSKYKSFALEQRV